MLAEYVIAQKGVVFGAAYNEDFSVSHQYAENVDGLHKFCRAKYVQSDIGLSYQQVKKFLDQDRYVLFSGTPCQIAGLKSFLNKTHDKLLCVDLICHGIPSPKVWKHYIDYRANIDNDGKPPISINMRSKTTGWQKYSVEFQYTDKKYSAIFAEDPYMKGYIKDLFTRTSCFECKFKGINRISDFTLGDFWGVEGQHPEMNDGKGTSLVFVHSEKAEKIWSEIKNRLLYKEVESEAAIQWNPMAVQSTPYQEKREDFFERYQVEDFEELVRGLIPKSTPSKAGTTVRIKNIIRRIIRNN